jgi:drug/metabolite transporter (DMT)-like permease
LSERVHPQFAAGVLAAAFAAVLWGAQFPIAKGAFESVDPFHVTLIRYGVATLILLPVFLWREGLAGMRYYGRFRQAALFGSLGLCISPMLVFCGISLSRPEHAAVIVALQPSVTALAEWWVRGRRPQAFTIGCILVALIGVVTVVTRWDLALHVSAVELLGDLLVLLGMLCWIAYVMASELFKGWSAMRLTMLTVIPASLVSLAITLCGVALGWIHVPDRAALAAAGWELAYLALAGVVLSMVCWNWGNQRIGPLNAVLLSSLLPVTTFLVRAWQGYRFAPLEIAGVALVVAALIANNLYQRRLRLR